MFDIRDEGEVAVICVQKHPHSIYIRFEMP